jgi:hypothetical protein
MIKAKAITKKVSEAADRSRGRPGREAKAERRGKVEIEDMAITNINIVIETMTPEEKGIDPTIVR